MERLVLLLVVLLLVFGSSQSEVPDFNITPDNCKYRGFAFQVGFEPRELMHDQFQVYDIVISIKHDKRKHLDPEGYIEVWDGRQFIYSCSVPQTPEDLLSIILKKKVETKDALLFFFSMNPQHIQRSWFNYQVLRDDGSVEMNCLIRLKDFVGGAPTENLAPTTGGRRKP